MNILGLIPARGGSKGIPLKNLAPLAGRPLIEYAIKSARACQRLSRVLVSTDHQDIAEAAIRCGAEAPFLRPPEISGDESPVIELVQHADRWLDEHDGWRAEVIVLLQPTSPFRTFEHIDKAINLLLDGGADSVVSVMPVPHQFSPVSLVLLRDGKLVRYLDDQPQPTRRQDKPLLYARNGPAVLACRADTTIRRGKLYGDVTLPLMMTAVESIDIDSPFDLLIAEAALSARRQ